jgi:hypothetical protein
LAQSRYKELTTPEIALWKAKLSAYPNELIEWALLSYNGEFFPNPSAICRMIELKQEQSFAEQQQAEWPAWKASQAQAEREGSLATDADYEQLRKKCREILAKAPVITAAGRPYARRTPTNAVSEAASNESAVVPESSGGMRNASASAPNHSEKRIE